VADWRAGRSTGRTLWRDEVLVGMVDSPEIALEIVGAMRAVTRLLDGSTKGLTAPCACSLCQSGDGRYHARCPVCEVVVEVERGRFETHDHPKNPSIWCAGSDEEAS
jgi:hypothetical protein